MSTKKIYFILLALITVLIFGVAAICGNCSNLIGTSSSVSTESSSQTTVSGGQGSTTTIAQSSSTTQSTSAATTSTSSSSEGSPTISLSVYEGPVYSSADNIYYFRVEATVTGNPSPTVSFNRDDSHGAWGSKKTQVNLSPGESFNLIATATNSKGTASANITLVAPGTGSSTSSSTSSTTVNHAPDVADINTPGGTLYTDTIYVVSAAASDSDGDSLTYLWTATGGTFTNPNVNLAQWKTPAAAGDYTIQIKVTDGKGGETNKTKTVNVQPGSASVALHQITSEGGYIEQTGYINAGGCIYAGDSGAPSGALVGNKPVRGYVSYDITGLAGTTIQNATLTFSIKKKWGNPSALGDMWLGVVDWGAHPLVLSDYDLSGVGIQLFPSAGDGNFTCTAASLKTQLQNAVTAGKTRFQIRIHMSSVGSNSDNNWDGFEYDQGGVNINVTYTH